MNQEIIHILKQAKEKIENLENDNLRLEKQVNGIMLENKFVINEIESLEEEIKLLEKEKEKVKKEREQIAVEREKYSQKVEKNVDFNNDLREEISKLNKYINNMKDLNVYGLEQENRNTKDMQVILDALIYKQEAFESETLILKNSLIKTENKLLKLELAIKKIEKEKENFQKEFIENKVAVSAILEDNEKILANIKSENRKLEKEKEKLLSALKEDNYEKKSRAKVQEQILEKVQVEKEVLRKQVEYLKNELVYKMYEIDQQKELSSFPNYINKEDIFSKSYNENLEESYIDFYKLKQKEVNTNKYYEKIQQLENENLRLKNKENELKLERKINEAKEKIKENNFFYDIKYSEEE